MSPGPCCIELGSSDRWRGLSGNGAGVRILAVWFGFVYGGIPSGVMGVCDGWLAWAALREGSNRHTRGLRVPWALQVSAVAAIYTFLAVAAVTSTARQRKAVDP